jgi:hypothetical protein
MRGGDLERTRALASNWEAEVGAVRAADQELRSWLQEAQAQQSQAEERARAAEQKAKEADELKATLDAKVAALATAEDQLLQERTARQGAEGQLQQERTALADARSALERERTACEAAQKSLEERNVEFSKLEGELVVLASQVRARSRPSRSRVPPLSACSRRSRLSAAPSRWRGSRSKVGCCSISCFTDLPFEGSFPLLISFLLVTLRPAHRAQARDRPGRGAAGLLQLLRAGATGAAFRGPRDLPGRGGGRGAGWKLAG